MNQSHVSNSNHMSHSMHHHSHEVQHKSNMSKQHHANSHANHCMMKMYFYTGVNETILFKPWVTTSIPLFIASWILIFIFGILYEGIREYRLCLEENQLIRRPMTSHDGNATELEHMNNESSKSTVHVEKKILPRYSTRTLYSILYAVQLSLGYMLMLIAMTFNVYLFLAIIIGIGTGHLLYTWARITSSTSKNERDT